MINRILLSTVAIATLTATAFAADLPSRTAPAVFVPPPAPIFTWTGFYLGGNAGYAFQADRTHNLTGNSAANNALVLSHTIPGSVQKSDRISNGRIDENQRRERRGRRKKEKESRKK